MALSTNCTSFFGLAGFSCTAGAHLPGSVPCNDPALNLITAGTEG